VGILCASIAAARLALATARFARERRRPDLVLFRLEN